MLKTHVRPSRDLRNNYAELAGMVKEHDQVIITNNGKGEAVLIGIEDYAQYEEFLHRRYVAEELAKAFNLNRATIFRILKGGGDSYHRHLDTKIETSTSRRIKDFKQGFVDYAKKNPNTPVENLAREYGISPSSGFKYLHEAGIYRGKGRKKKAAKPKR